jgi:DNA-directed RNA polymerase specialized sigma subunit
MLGLIRAVEKFDWRRGCKFSTFAYPHIEGSVKKAARAVQPSAELSLDFDLESTDGAAATLVETVASEPPTEDPADPVWELAPP